MTLVYDLIYLLAALLGWPWLIYRRITRGPGSLALGERLGGVPSRPVASQCVWIHGVSLGEINATRTLVQQLRLRQPNLAIAISSTTSTGLARARELYPRCTVFRFPLDFSACLRRVLNRIRPTVIVLMELEVWPNLIELARSRGIPIVIANGRITEQKSMRVLRRWPLRGVARRMFRSLDWIGAQDETYAGRFAELGAPADRIEITGSLKYDAANPGEAPPGVEPLADAMGIDRSAPLWVCGSTGPDEEAMLLSAYRELRAAHASLQLAIVPRKPERFDEVARRIEQSGWRCIRRSEHPDRPADDAAAQPAADDAVFLGDTMGELRRFYALADVIFVGRTLVPLGGSDVMEAAALGRPVVVGPHYANFTEAVELLLAEGGAVRVATGEELMSALGELLSNVGAARTRGEAARRAILSRRGATEKTVHRLLELLESAETAAS